MSRVQAVKLGVIICHVGCITRSFLNFFPVLGEHSVNHGWLCSGEDVCEGSAQEWLYSAHRGASISTKTTK